MRKPISGEQNACFIFDKMVSLYKNGAKREAKKIIKGKVVILSFLKKGGAVERGNEESPAH
jgi:hypothetical protein